MNTHIKGYEGERIVLEYYKDHGYTHVVSNFTVRGGEIDIIVENTDTTVFIEVKVVDHIDDLFGYVTEKKLYFIQKTIAYYAHTYAVKPNKRVDVVFVKNGKIYEIYQDV